MIVPVVINAKNPRNLTKRNHDLNYTIDLEDILTRLDLSSPIEDFVENSREIEYSADYDELVPNMVVCTNIYSSKFPNYNPEMITFKGDDCMEKFILFATSYNKGNNVFIAHNGSGFDSKFVFVEALRMVMGV